MALTKVNRGGLNTGIADSSNATFLTATSAEGVTLAGTLAVTGVHTVGTNAVATSEGGAETASVVQGLAKAWINFTGVSTTAARDSVNISGLTDVATAKTTVAYTNNMGNTNYTGSYFQTGSTEQLITSFNNHYTGGFGARTTGSCGVHSYIGTSAGDVADNDVLIFGDLA